MPHPPLTPEERADLESLLLAAAHDDDGNRLPTSQWGTRMRDLLVDADKDGHAWASWITTDATVSGLRDYVKAWIKEQDRQLISIETADGFRTISKSALRGVVRREKVGTRFHQQVLWEDLTRADLELIMSESGKRIFAERVTIAGARKCLELLDTTGATVVSEGLTLRGISLDELLGENVA